MSENLIPSSHPHALTIRCATVMRAVTEVMECVVADLPPEKSEALATLMRTGGRVGLETTVDRNGAPRIVLIGIEQEGMRLELATITADSVGACTQTH